MPIRLLNEGDPKKIEVAGGELEIKTLTIPSQIRLSEEFQALTSGAFTSGKYDQILDLLARNVISIDGETSDIKGLLSRIEDYKVLFEIGERIVNQSKLTPDEVKNSPSSSAGKPESQQARDTEITQPTAETQADV